MFRLTENLPSREENLLKNLRSWLLKAPDLCVAYSGGVDSSLVAALAFEQKGESAFAVTGISPALASHLLQEARQQAAWIGIRHIERRTKELDDPNYSNNPKNRCYACKHELHKHLTQICINSGNSIVVDGVNLDDLSDHRPGIIAAREAGVVSPLAELGIDKKAVRTISYALGFPWWDKPAQPCLASRFPYGEGITASRLNMVNKAESYLIKIGFTKVRVRIQGLSARIEVPKNRIQEIINLSYREKLIESFLEIGFTSVSLDLEGLISGKLNR